MRGSIVKRENGNYSIVYDVGYKWTDGKRIRNQKWETVGKNKKEAEKALALRLAEIANEEYVDPTKLTFGEFKDTWMANYAEGEGEIRHSTLVLYRGLFKRHLLPAFGEKLLTKITTEDVQAFKARMLKSGKKITIDGETVLVGLSPQTVKHQLRLLRQMYNHAIDWGYVRSNPTRKVRMPKIPKNEMDFLTPEEITAFFEKVPEKWYAFFLTAITTGLRIGEMIAMRWANVDWQNGKYHVKETWLRSRGGRKATFGVPKTESSVVAVDLTPACMAALEEHRRVQSESKLAMGEDYLDQDLVFATDMGTPLDDSHINKRHFKPALRDAGLREIRPHDLRRTSASLLIAQEESPKYIQMQLRHVSIDITFDRYGHLFPDANREAAARLDETLGLTGQKRKRAKAG